MLKNNLKINPYLIFKFKGIDYKMDDTSNLVTNEKGIKNRKLTRIIKQKKASMKVLKGFDAYQKYGCEYVVGVVEIDERKQ